MEFIKKNPSNSKKIDRNTMEARKNKTQTAFICYILPYHKAVYMAFYGTLIM